MSKIRKLLCKLGFHSYQHKRIERFYPYKYQKMEHSGYEYGTKSITHYDKCSCCGKEKNNEHIKLPGCSRWVLKFPELLEEQPSSFIATFSGCKAKEMDNE